MTNFYLNLSPNSLILGLTRFKKYAVVKKIPASAIMPATEAPVKPNK